MKAWIVTADDDNGSSIVFAETRGKAKALAQYTDACEDAYFTDIRAIRIPDLDGMENCEPKDNPWLNEDIRIILVRDHDWACIDPWDSECDECVAKQYCHYFEE